MNVSGFYRSLKTALFFICFLSLSIHSIAQAPRYPGDWYILSNEKNPLSTGEDYTIKVVKKGAGYFIINPGNNYSADLPDTGYYSVNNNGDLTKSGITLSFQKGRMFYKNNNVVELINKQNDSLVEYYFHYATSILDNADSTNKSREKDPLKKCIRFYDKALSFGPCRDCYFNRCLADFRLGNIDEAVEDMRNVELTYPGYPRTPDLARMLGNYYAHHAWDKYGKNGALAQAISECKKGLDIDPENPDLWYSLGGAYFTNKQYKEAIAAFKRCLEINPQQEHAQEGIDAAEAAMMEGK